MVLDDGSPMHADVVVGADGVGSVVRQALHPREAAARPSGYHALRGVSYDVGDRLGTADTAIYLGDGVEIGFARASASAVYWYISLVDELAATDPANTLDRCTRGLDPVALAITRAARPDDMRADRLFYREPLDAWGRGTVTLLGDAAHPVLPHTAQGAALALEDAVALALALEGDDTRAELRRYERVRATRAARVVRTGPRIAAMTTTRSRARIAVRNALVRLIPGRAMSAVLTAHARDPHRALRSQTTVGSRIPDRDRRRHRRRRRATRTCSPAASRVHSVVPVAPSVSTATIRASATAIRRQRLTVTSPTRPGERSRRARHASS